MSGRNGKVYSSAKWTVKSRAENLGVSFPTKNLGEFSYYLRYHITRDREAKTVTFDQHRVLRWNLERWNCSSGKAIRALGSP